MSGDLSRSKENSKSYPKILLKELVFKTSGLSITSRKDKSSSAKSSVFSLRSVPQSDWWDFFSVYLLHRRSNIHSSVKRQKRPLNAQLSRWHAARKEWINLGAEVYI